VDGGYTREAFADAVKGLLDAGVEVAKRSELHTFAVIPKRWGGNAASHGWIVPPALEKLRRFDQYQLANGRFGVSGVAAEKIVNRFLVRGAIPPSLKRGL